ANDVPEHREVLGNAGSYYRGAAELAAVLQRILDEPETAADLRSRARARARQEYSWDAVTDAYEGWFRRLVLPSVR
ncbi:MAG: glycosyltransferase, partial [Candidatus Limnocylindrales bacterium]